MPVVTPAVGDLWHVRTSRNRLVLIVFARSASADATEDIRGLPVYTESPAFSFASEADLVLGDASSDLGTPLLIACWNARRFAPDDLDYRVGRASAETLSMARALELAVLVAPERRPVGLPSGTLSGDDPGVVRFQREELRRWDDIEDRLERCYVNSSVTYTWNDFSPVALARARRPQASVPETYGFVMASEDDEWILEVGDDFGPGLAKVA